MFDMSFFEVLSFAWFNALSLFFRSFVLTFTVLHTPFSPNPEKLQGYLFIASIGLYIIGITFIRITLEQIPNKPSTDSPPPRECVHCSGTIYLQSASVHPAGRCHQTRRRRSDNPVTIPSPQKEELMSQQTCRIGHSQYPGNTGHSSRFFFPFPPRSVPFHVDGSPDACLLPACYR